MGFFRTFIHRVSPLYHELETLLRRIPQFPRNLMVTALFLTVSTWLLSRALDHGLSVGGAYAQYFRKCHP